MSTTATVARIVERGVTNDVIIAARGARFHWAGPGATVRLVFGDALVSIDSLQGWAAADESEARAQVRDFFRGA